MNKLFTAFALGVALAAPAHADFNPESWPESRTIVVDTSATGAPTQGAVSNAVVPIRLHSGNLDFAAAKPDGSDLRFIAADGKTELKFHLERFESVDELGLAWVQLPQVAGNSDAGRFSLHFGNPDAAPAGDSKASFDASYAALFQFAPGDRAPQDATRNGNNAATELAVDAAGLLGGAGVFAGQPMVLAASPSLKLAGAWSFSAWLKPQDVTPRAALYRQGPLVFELEAGKLRLSAGAAAVEGGSLQVGAWQHVVATVGAGKATLYLNGVQVAQADVNLPEAQEEVRIGEGYTGLLDQVALSSSARSADWVALAHGGEVTESLLLTVAAEEVAEGGEHSYFGILVGNLTTDAWVVIIILMIMFVIAAVVMVTKSLFVGRTDRDNRAFLTRFRGATDDFLKLDQGAVHPNSSLYRLYQSGIRELRKRFDAHDSHDHGQGLSGASLDAIKAAIDADMVRESHKLNSQMVLLTIAISGGPFLGLLGTVVGVMITFAAIAAAGDVNVNAIAPGIAAALLATVAGLAVAIPALFGYNYLAARIKNISADMQIFVDEFVTRVAETYGAR